jgi:hypothetical protein
VGAYFKSKSTSGSRTGNGRWIAESLNAVSGCEDLASLDFNLEIERFVDILKAESNFTP